LQRGGLVFKNPGIHAGTKVGVLIKMFRCLNSIHRAPSFQKLRGTILGISWVTSQKNGRKIISPGFPEEIKSTV
jgi:hypothetical protein